MAKQSPSLQDFFQGYFSTFVDCLSNAPDANKMILSSKLFSAGLITTEARSEFKSTDILQTIETIVKTSGQKYAIQTIADFLCILGTQPATKGLAERFCTDFHQEFNSELPQPSEKVLKAVAPASETSRDHKVVHSDPCKHGYDLQPTPQTGTPPSHCYPETHDLQTHLQLGGYSQVTNKISQREPSNTLHSSSTIGLHSRKRSHQDTESLSNITSLNAPTLNESEKSLVNDRLSADMPEVHGQGVSQHETAQGVAGSAVVPPPSDFQSQLSERAELANPHKSHTNTQVCGTKAGVHVKDCCSCVPIELHQQVCGDKNLLLKQNARLREENSKLQNKIDGLEVKVAELKWLIETKDTHTKDTHKYTKKLEERLINM